MTAHAQIQSTRPALADCPDSPCPESGTSSEAASTPTDQLFREHEMDDYRETITSTNDPVLSAREWVVIGAACMLAVAYTLYRSGGWPFV